MNKLLLLFLLSVSIVHGQTDTIVHRVIFIGDAGEINTEQHALVECAAELVIGSRTTTFFLGDNIYPVGMPIDSLSQHKERLILRSQFEPFRKRDVPVYFLAGNHDWNRSRKLGLEKLIAQEEFLTKQNDPLLSLIPKAGMAGPIMMPLNDSLVAIVYDSEYWLFPHHKKSKSELEQEWDRFMHEMDSLFRFCENKSVLLLSHHPMLSYGEHGLRFSWKHHIFPLTTRWKNLYIPLPGVGSLFPLLRSTVFRSAEDLPHPKYKKIRQEMIKLANYYPKLLFVSGHDHGLQFVRSGNIKQLVSGAGAKINAMTSGKGLIYGHKGQGFSIVDLTSTGKLILRFYTYEKEDVRLSFESTVFFN